MWSPRRFNSVADHCANAAMHEKCNWLRLSPSIQDPKLQTCNLRLCVDGGRRNEHEAAVGIALYAAAPNSAGP